MIKVLKLKEGFLIQMSKKKKNTKKRSNNLKVVKKNIKILESGKLMINGDQKISLKPYIRKSVDDTVCSRLPAIISKEDVAIESKAITKRSVNITSLRKAIEIESKMDSVEKQTVCYVVSKKNATDIFDFMDNSIIGYLLRSSTLASIYKEVKAEWVKLNEKDKSSFTNVLYIPNVYVFLDEETGKIRKRPFTVNLLITAEPSPKNMGSDDGTTTIAEEVESDEATNRVVSDILESAVKCGAKNLIISPYCHKILLKDERETAEIWERLTTTQRYLENINKINFAINDDDLYIIFKNKITT